MMRGKRWDSISQREFEQMEERREAQALYRELAAEDEAQEAEERRYEAERSKPNPWAKGEAS